MFELKDFDYFNAVISLIIGLITLYLVRFYSKVFSLPRGPFPLPVLGNVLVFKGTKKNQFESICEMHKKYGSVLTIWLGPTPALVIADYEVVKKVFNSPKNELMGRLNSKVKKMILGEGSDVLFSDHGPSWASLRKVAHMATRKLAISENFGYLVDDVVGETMQKMIETEGFGKEFNPTHYIYMSVFNIIASSAFGKRYAFDDKELIFYEKSMEYFRAKQSTVGLTDRIPILYLINYNIVNKWRKTFKALVDNVRQKYMDRLKDHQKGVIQHFCDALIEAKEEAISEAKESAPHLTDINLSFVIMNLFQAGSDTTQYMIRWIILFMANNPQMQNRMRDEIENIIGDRIAVHEDRINCHYINAFIAEVLRFRPVAPLGSPHRAICDYRFENHFIAKDSMVFSNLMAISRDPKFWEKPELFDPNRFLTTDNKFISNKTGFVPFGIGRRICLGEKLALEDMFFITVRLLKSTTGCSLALPGGEGSADLDPNPDILFFCTPKPFKIIIKKDSEFC